MDFEKKTIERIRFASEMSLSYYKKPIVCTYSGGKDSDLMLEMFIRSGVPFEVHNSHTTVDAPQTVYHIRNRFKKLEEAGIKCKNRVSEIDHVATDCQEENAAYADRQVLLFLSQRKFLPKSHDSDRRALGRKQRQGFQGGGYEVLGKTKKELISLTDEEIKGISKTPEFEQMTIPGIETGEIMLMNDNSKKRKFIERCEMKAKTVCNPIIEWPDSEVWNFIESEHIEVNPLYKMGFHRVGCIGCPMASKMRYFEFEMLPTYKAAYIRAFDRMIEAMKNNGTGRIPKWRNGTEVFRWWMEESDIPGQLSFLEDNL